MHPAKAHDHNACRHGLRCLHRQRSEQAHLVAEQVRRQGLTTPQDSYWLKQPYSVLFDLLHLHRVKPWDVHLAELLTGLMGEMRGRGYIDFSVSGTALLTSAVLLRMKSELFLKLEEPPKPP